MRWLPLLACVASCTGPEVESRTGDGDLVQGTGDDGMHVPFDSADDATVDELLEQTLCKDGSDCASGYCVPTPSGLECAETCFDSCPHGWSCTLLTNTGGDTTYLCLPNFTYLCRPCESNADCVKDAASAGACLRFDGGIGNFCGIECTTPTDCPDGYGCETREDLGGTGRSLCVPTSGICACNGTAIADKARTSCLVFGDGGYCIGQRECGPEGLTECATLPPSAEVCNDVDDDCDGATDEDTEGACAVTNDLGSCPGMSQCISGEVVCDAATPSPEACDGYDNDCNGSTDLAYVAGPGSALVDVCAPGGPCLVLGSACDDGDLCTFEDVCTGAACKGKSAACLVCETCDGFGGCTLQPGFCRIDGACYAPGATQIGNSCHVCVPSSNPLGWTAHVDGKACDDGEKCTLYDLCVQGECKSGSSPCLACEQCLPSGACVPGAGWCTIDDVCVPAGVPKPGGQCLSCDPLLANDQWTFTEGATCSDGNACTVADTCQAGACSGLPVSCGGLTDTCNVGTCVGGQCQAVPVDGPCDDGDACTPTQKCSAGVCVGTSVIECDDSNPCTDDECNAATGCTITNNDTLCEDGDTCTGGDMCVGGVCAAVNVPCDDFDTCTVDSCDAAGMCHYESLCCGKLGVPCPDGFTCSDLGTCEDEDEVFVPEGLHWRGCDGGPTCNYSVRPAHKVWLSAFAIDRTEVTVAAYKECVLAGECVEPCPCNSYHNYGKPSHENHPMNEVGWKDAKGYCEWRGKRLPTEAEWDRAARGGCETIDGDCKTNQRAYPWGNDPPSCNLAVIAVKLTSANLTPGCGKWEMDVVGSRPAGRSPYGAHDMAGNALEWTSDWFMADYFCKGPNATCYAFYGSDAPGCSACANAPPYQELWDNPQGPPSGTQHVRLGGSLFGVGAAVGSMDRTFLISSSSMAMDPVMTGFRCARSP